MTITDFTDWMDFTDHKFCGSETGCHEKEMNP